MDFLADSLGTIALWIIPFLAVLTVIVFVHEMGHFLVARWCGAGVSAFSIGFGRELCGWTDKRGTRWKISAIPLGGYVKFVDDENAASMPTGKQRDIPANGLQAQPLWARASIVAAGPIANFLFAILVFAAMLLFLGKPIVAPVVGSVEPGSAAAQAQLQPGDVSLEIEGQALEGFNDIRRHVSMNAGRELDVVIERAGERIALVLTPTSYTMTTRFGTTETIGIIGVRGEVNPQTFSMRQYGPLEAVWGGVEETWFIIDQTITYVSRIFTGEANADQLGGPIKIAQITNHAAQADDLIPLIQLVALLSVSIGLINLFPIPLLDGGHLMFYALEALRGRPLSAKSQERAATLGFALIMSLMVFAFWNDLT